MEIINLSFAIIKGHNSETIIGILIKFQLDLCIVVKNKGNNILQIRPQCLDITSLIKHRNANICVVSIPKSHS